MRYIGTVQAVVTAAEFDREPTDAELAGIEVEMPVILAEVALLDAQLMTLDRPASEVDTRRIRRAEHKLLTERRHLANVGRQSPAGVGA
ncbi:DUF6284 family protein [Streptomyces sp. H10-C2]|uniref:DUF6284 family protein n=1 Tax=unclassified Streptomyces TaxID=2593676 RepID=UPI0024BBD142|nr:MULTISPECIES: DUF6284 family protein [unclassified Streptomyces]MDJ0341373.1 DUF6284 family protein [Streptomyces sp. PH10-H1]MDJ0370968.1 DUF6284 family protein [Streptomyces sp. H10-C2]